MGESWVAPVFVQACDHCCACTQRSGQAAPQVPGGGNEGDDDGISDAHDSFEMRSKLEFKSFERIKFETAPLIIKVGLPFTS